MSVLDNFQEWKNFLAERVNQAQNLGMDQDTIKDVAYQMGDYLAKDVEPKNPQERVLKELWNVANEEEQRTIAGLMVKLANNQTQQ